MKTNKISDREQLIHRIGFLEGAIEGITLYAIWRDGIQLVGCKPLAEVLHPYKEELLRLRRGETPVSTNENECDDVPH